MTEQLPNQAVAFFTGKRVLITGGAGYLAAALVNLLENADCHIIRLGRPGAVFAPVSGLARVEDVAGDVREHATWDYVLQGTDVVFHLAAQTSAYVANQEPLADLSINVVPMIFLLETCRRQGHCPSVLFSSTTTVVGIPAYLPVDEKHPDCPGTVYDIHKLVAEHYLKVFAMQGWVRGAVLRLANVYGPGPTNSRSDRGVLNKMIRNALAGRPLTIYGRGDEMRDYVYVEDVAWAFLEAANKMDRLNGRNFVIGSGCGHTLAQAITLVSERAERKTGMKVPVLHVDPPSPQLPIEFRNFVADSSRFEDATGWCARLSLTEGIDRTIEALQ